MKNKTEIRFIKSQKKGLVAITKGDLDWNSGISEKEMLIKLDIIKHSITRGI